MSEKEFEQALGIHCAPTLLGIKPANLVSFSKTKAPNVMEHILKYSARLKKEGICLKVVCGCKKHYLLLVYRPELLYEYLSRPENRSFLAEQGYDPVATPQAYIDTLTERYAKNQQCPHEIGIFLGYPLEDVIGFTLHKGNDYKYCGHWKVYGDVQSAIELFTLYKECSRFTCDKIKEGYTITQVIEMKKMCA